MATIQIDGTLADAREVARTIAAFLALEFGELTGGDLTAEGGELQVTTDDGECTILIMPSRHRTTMLQRAVDEFRLYHREFERDERRRRKAKA